MLIMVLVAIAARGESLPDFVMPSHEMDYVDSVQLQVSDRLHFPDSSTFGKYFKRLTDMSPKEFRSQGSSSDFL